MTMMKVKRRAKVRTFRLEVSKTKDSRSQQMHRLLRLLLLLLNWSYH